MDGQHHQRFSFRRRAESMPSGSQPLATRKDAFVGRVGGNQTFVLDRDDTANADALEKAPDAAPFMTLAEQFDLQGFRTLALWRSALVEGMGCMLFFFVTMYIGAGALEPSAPFTPRFGPFDNASFIGPLVGGFTNWALLTLFILSFGAVSGGHLNPTITIATFFAQLCSLPRMILYIAFQTGGASLAGLLVRAALGTRAFKVGGCWLHTDLITLSSAFVLEFVTCMALLFIAFGVGLDPRQAKVIGPALSPFLVGMTLGVLSFGTGFGRYGYGGTSLNPARCFGVFVGTAFPGWHWIHWVAPIAAAAVHGIFYYLVPPGLPR